MNNRDNNENIYRHLEKCYALLQVHILFSFHTLLYILLITHRKVRKIIGEYQRKSEKIRENRGKSGNFRGIHSSKWQNRREILRSFPAISGRFRSFPVIFARFSGHFRSFPVIPGYDSAKSFLFFPFHSSTPYFYALQHIL